MGQELLLIEADASSVEFIIQVLCRVNSDIHVEVAQDGGQALDYLFGTGKYIERDTQRLPDLILLNLNLPSMPGFGGMDILRVAKSYARTRTIPIVILTESRGDEQALESYHFSANSYVEKSDNLEEFQQALEMVGRYWLTINRRTTRSAVFASMDDDQLPRAV